MDFPGPKRLLTPFSFFARVLAACLAVVGCAAVVAPPAQGQAMPMPTLGGLQFWADVLFFHGWHIQRHVSTGQCRLLDEKNFRHASGTYDECRAALEQIKRQRRLPPMQGKAVLLLHGLGRYQGVMAPMARHLSEKGGYHVFRVTYPSTQADIAAHARGLKQVIDNLEGIEEINFVAHSLGNIVVRHYLGDVKGPNRNRPIDPRIRRFVMLGPPNQRAYLALLLADWGPFRLVTGEAGQQIGIDWDRLEPHLATPEFEFGIIAGGKGDDEGYLKGLIPGDDDGVISVATTRIYGASDFLVVPVHHAWMNSDPKVHEAALRFLRHGYFVSPEARQPIGRPARSGERGAGSRE